MERPIIKKEKGMPPQNIPDTLAEEVRLRLYCETHLLQEFDCSPLDFSALAAGYLYAEGKLAKDTYPVFIRDAVPQAEDCYTLEIARASLCQDDSPSHAYTPAKTGLCDLLDESMQCIDWDKAMGYAADLLSHSDAFRHTGCIHTATLCKGGKTCYTGEDVSRFYALYKVIGKALLDRAEISSFVLCTTGRLPLAYMERVIRCGIRCVISRSAPTAQAVSFAHRHGAALFGFARANQLNFYPPLSDAQVAPVLTSPQTDT